MEHQDQIVSMTLAQDMTASGNPIFAPPSPTWSESDLGDDQTQIANHVASVSPSPEPQIGDSRVTKKSQPKVITAPVAAELTKADKEDGQFTMEHLLDSRIVKRNGKFVTEYLVSWAGDWPKKLKTSWSIAIDIDPAEIAYFEATRPKKISGSKAVDDFIAKGMQPLFDLEATLGGSDSDDESASSEDDDFINDEGEDVESSDEEIEADDEGSEYSPEDDEVEVDDDPSGRKTSENDASESDSEEMEVDNKAPKKEALKKEESSDDSSDSEEDADGEEISQEEQDLLDKQSIFNKK